MPGLAAFPILEMLSRSASAPDRASFVRVFGDYSAFLHKQDVEMPGDWLDALKICLENARLEERGAHLAALAKIASVSENPGASAQAPSSQAFAFAGDESTAKDATVAGSGQPRFAGIAAGETAYDGEPAEDIAGLLQDGDLDALIALASNQFARLTPEETGLLVARARMALETLEDRRLTHAILARSPIRIETAPLFLEATSDQRWAIVLAAQRAELGRRKAGAFATIGRETIARLEYAAITGNAEQFHGLLGRAIGAPLELAARIADDPTGEPLVMALVAIGAPNDVCVRILAANDMREHGRFHRLHALSRLSGGASPLAARRILSAILGAPRSTPAPSPKTPIAPRQPRLAAGWLRPEALPAKGPSVQPRKASAVGAK